MSFLDGPRKFRRPKKRFSPLSIEEKWILKEIVERRRWLKRWRAIPTQGKES